LALRIKVFPSAIIGGTIVVKRLIGLSMKGFKRSRLIRIQVLSDALPLEGVPTWVTRVAKKCVLEYHSYFLHVLLLDHMFMHGTTDLCRFKTP
jgi:hypothetical protein